MRLLAALIYTGAGILLVGEYLIESIPPFLSGLIFLALLFSSVIIFNRNPWGTLTRQSHAEHVKELDKKGLLVRETYTSNKAFSFEDYRTGCLAYILQLSDNRVLCVYGQDYYKYEPSADGEEPKTDRQFPCNKFILLRHKKRKEVVNLILEGKVFEPEIIQPPSNDTLLAFEARLKKSLNDGDIYDHVTYEELQSIFR
ncbi:MAG: hypothetical protein CMK33_05595 [Porticoccaceae bacterium]|nr:hypothetical protein [Porticoccaceae bacterium]